MTTRELKELLRILMEFDSTSGKETNVANYLVHWLNNHNYTVINGESYLYAIPNNLTGNPIRAILCSHLDTVPPYLPYSEKLIGENNYMIHGRGACDAKGQIVSLIGASLSLQESNINNALLFTYGEETEHCGIKKASAELDLQADKVIVGEPTELKLMSTQKGCMSGTIECFGKACHSGYPEYGNNALTRLMLNLLRVKEHPELTFNPIISNGGEASNVVPSYAKAEFTVRSNLSCDKVKEILNTLWNLEFDYQTKVKWNSHTDPVQLSVDVGEDNNLLSNLEIEQAGFVTDLAYLKCKSNNGDNISPLKYLIGPGSIRDAHTNNEHILLSDIIKAIDIYVLLARR